MREEEQGPAAASSLKEVLEALRSLDSLGSLAGSHEKVPGYDPARSRILALRGRREASEEFVCRVRSGSRGLGRAGAGRILRAPEERPEPLRSPSRYHW